MHFLRHLAPRQFNRVVCGEGGSTQWKEGQEIMEPEPTGKGEGDAAAAGDRMLTGGIFGIIGCDKG